MQTQYRAVLSAGKQSLGLWKTVFWPLLVMGKIGVLKWPNAKPETWSHSSVCFVFISSGMVKLQVSAHWKSLISKSSESGNEAQFCAHLYRDWHILTPTLLHSTNPLCPLSSTLPSNSKEQIPGILPRGPTDSGCELLSIWLQRSLSPHWKLKAEAMEQWQKSALRYGNFFFEDFIIHRFETLPVSIIKVIEVPSKEQWFWRVGEAGRLHIDV